MDDLILAPIATITSDEAILARGVRVKLGIELDPGVYVIAATYDTEGGTWRSVASMNLLVRDSEIRFDEASAELFQDDPDDVPVSVRVEATCGGCDHSVS